MFAFLLCISLLQLFCGSESVTHEKTRTAGSQHYPHYNNGKLFSNILENKLIKYCICLQLQWKKIELKNLHFKKTWRT